MGMELTMVTVVVVVVPAFNERINSACDGASSL